MQDKTERLPEQFKKNMKELLGEEEYESYLESFKQDRLYSLRINTAKISVEDFLRISPFALRPIPWIPNGFYYDKEENPAKHPYYFAGLYYLQEPSAMTPAHVLPVREGDRVLDLCAAPGGKSTALGAKLQGTGLLVSNDISASRAKALLKNIEVFGIDRVLVTCEYPEKLAEHFPEYFDQILVDAPCSGEGMFRKDGKLMTSWMTEGPDFYAPIQKGILNAAALMCKPGGNLVYSTCTFSRKEDEDNIREFLMKHPDFSLTEIEAYEGFVRGYDLPEAIRLFPHHLEGEGHFVALLHREGETVGRNASGPAKGSFKIPPEMEEFFSHCHYDLSELQLQQQGDMVMACDPGLSFLKGLRILRSGLLLGESKKNRFEPSQALAMALTMEEYDTILNLKAEDPRTVKYLKGETIDYAPGEKTGKEKDVLICVDGYPLGWGRDMKGSLKNRYLPGWRWM